MGASYGSLRATDFTAAAKKDDATVKWYHDSNAEISVGVPMAPPLPTDDAYFNTFCHSKHAAQPLISMVSSLVNDGVVSFCSSNFNGFVMMSAT
ncbi:hypothetical protein Tco_1052240 [Tanacetum coccineum]|uniref:Uncharacterized protein n=1 Tax=Tanacetum coccineum TaxID=301880 RepID=A0ABQ5IMK9_9ASTR